MDLICEHCGQTFIKQAHLTNHIRYKHSENTQEPAMTEIKQTKDETKTKQQPPEPTAKAPTALTPDERALVDTISRQTDDWTQITEDDIHDFSLAEDPLKLPKEAQQRQDQREFAYRWCERTPKRIAELTNSDPPRKWWVANAVTAPYLKKYVDPTIGGVCRMDQILLLKPWKLHQMVKDAVAATSKALYQSKDLDKGGAAKIQSRDDRSHLAAVTGERAHVRTTDPALVVSGEAEDAGELVAAD